MVVNPWPVPITRQPLWPAPLACQGALDSDAELCSHSAEEAALLTLNGLTSRLTVKVLKGFWVCLLLLFLFVFFSFNAGDGIKASCKQNE